MEFAIGSIFPILTTTISFVFFGVVFEQYYRKRKAHQLIWSIAMLLFSVTAGAEAFSIIYGKWIPWVYRLYYVLAAIQVSMMGAGVIYLFDSRNVINERNTAKQFILFGSIWTLFSLLYSSRSSLFLLILGPAIVATTLGIIYYISRRSDKKLGHEILLCKFCRFEMTLNVVSEMKCNNCDSTSVVQDYKGAHFTAFWHNKITGRFFSNYFLVFSVFIFVLMNIPAWTSPLYEGLLVSGKEVSGLPWQIDPYNLKEPRAIVRLFSPLHTVPGAIALIGGGFYSYITWQLSIHRNKHHFELKTGSYNIWIALGALVLGQGGLFSGFGYTLGTFLPSLPPEMASIGFLYISEVVSVTMMLWGFLGSDKLSKEKLLNLLTLSGLKETQIINSPN